MSQSLIAFLICRSATHDCNFGIFRMLRDLNNNFSAPLKDNNSARLF
ncbi:unnamed protein product [Ixodes pacificus]